MTNSSHKMNLTRQMFGQAIQNSLKKFNPWILIKNPVIFVTEIGAFLSTLEAFLATGEIQTFSLHVALWLWFTVLFANFAESIAESRNQAQALKNSRKETFAHRIEKNGSIVLIPGSFLQKGDLVLVKTGEVIPGDGEIIEGTAAIDESSVTGESRHVIRSAGGDQNAVIAGTKVVSDQLKIRISSNPGESFLDRMISLIEGSKRTKTFNEIAITILLSGLTIIFLIVVASLKIFGLYFDLQISLAMLISFLVCLIPTTIAGLLSAIGISGINRLMQKNVLAMSGQAVEASGDIDIILFDKTGTITIGNRQAKELLPAEGISLQEMAKAAYIASFNDETTEGKSIVGFVKNAFPELLQDLSSEITLIPFSATTRISGADYKGESFRKGARDSIEKFTGKALPEGLAKIIEKEVYQDQTPLFLARGQNVLGVIFLKDLLKPGLSKQFSRFREIGIRTVMVTGDHEIVARKIAQEVGIDQYLSDYSPEKKLEYLKEAKKQGFMVAMTGDGVNDAPALAFSDVGVAMSTGTQAAKEAGNMIDLDSNPTKLFQIIEIGKQMLMTRGALTTFSIANDVAKYFVVLPSMLIPYFPFFEKFNIMNLSSPFNAILSAIIFNALIIVALIPLAFKGVKFIPQKAARILKRNLLLYGVGGMLLPFIGIKCIDMILLFLRGV